MNQKWELSILQHEGYFLRIFKYVFLFLAPLGHYFVHSYDYALTHFLKMLQKKLMIKNKKPQSKLHWRLLTKCQLDIGYGLL